MNTNLNTSQLLDQLNRFRATNGKAPLKSWKASRAQLEAAVNTEGTAATAQFEMPLTEMQKQSPHNDIATANTIPAAGGDTSTNVGTSNPEKTAALKAARKENDAKDASLAALEAVSPSPSADRVAKAEKEVKRLLKAPLKETKPAKKATKKTSKKSAGFSAATVIAEFGIAPKVGRALLRKNNVAKNADAIRAFFKARAK
jgi:hypothetical protein